MTTACIFGCGGQTLSDAERDFFRAVQPWGFIVFRRNIDSPDQLRRLTDTLRDTVGRDAPILIDQEGGRVQRMGPPHWPIYPPSRAYGKVAGGIFAQREAARLGARLMAQDLARVGVNVDCVPVLDVPAADGHEIIGDRAYAADAEAIAVLGRAAAEGMIAGGVLPVIKHIPGHGRARADSHHELPVVSASREDLEAVDFAPFKALSDMPMAMSAHVVYSAIDPGRPATLSATVISEIIRGAIGFDGLLMTDDLSMNALGGGYAARARDAHKAGCDIILHCNGDMDEMKAVAEGSQALDGASERRAEAAMARLARTCEPFDVEAARARFEAVMA